MKAFVVLFLVAAASASLEPAGYRPPGSSGPSSRYLPANRYDSSRSAPSSKYLPASRGQYSSSGSVPRPSNVYLPSNEYESSSRETIASVSRYSSDRTSPSSHSYPSSSSSSSPSFSSSYETSAPSRYSSPIIAPSSRYLPSNDDSNAGYSGYRYGAEEENSEPAKYEFNYRVQDEYGNDFGHQESRDGDETRGVYMVLLPDGRKQIVEYEANQEGFKPKITYEEPKRNGYDYNAGNRQESHSGGYGQGSAYAQGPY